MPMLFYRNVRGLLNTSPPSWENVQEQLKRLPLYFTPEEVYSYPMPRADAWAVRCRYYDSLGGVRWFLIARRIKMKMPSSGKQHIPEEFCVPDEVGDWDLHLMVWRNQSWKELTREDLSKAPALLPFFGEDYRYFRGPTPKFNRSDTCA